MFTGISLVKNYLCIFIWFTTLAVVNSCLQAFNIYVSMNDMLVLCTPGVYAVFRYHLQSSHVLSLHTHFVDS